MEPRRSRGAFLARILLILGLVAFALTGATFSAFSGTTVNGSNSFTATTIAAPTSLSVTETPSVALAWTATTSAFATGYTVLRATTSGGPYSQVGTTSGLNSTSYTDSPGAGTFYYVVRGTYQAWVSVNSNQGTRQDSKFVFEASTSFTGTNCAGAQQDHDMQQGYTPAGPEQSWHRTSGTGTANFCSDTFSGEGLAAGTTSFAGYWNNTTGSSCTITLTLYKNGATSLGSGSFSVPANTSKGLLTWTFSTSATAFASGDRLDMYVTWGTTASCNSSNLYWNGAASPSSVTVPTIS